MALMPGGSATVGASARPLPRLAIVASHPVQYISPWLVQLAARGDLELRVFYLWDLGVSSAPDPGFGQPLRWDIPMLEGYDHQFVANRAPDPGNHHFFGYINPGIVGAVRAWRPDAILLMNYAFLSYLLLLLDPRLWGTPFLFRGDSHDLGRSDSARSRLMRLLRSLLFRRFAAFLVAGNANHSYYRACGVPNARLFMGRHAVDNARFLAAAPQAARQARELRQQLGIGSERVILFVGKFVAIKRPLDLVRAYGALPQELITGSRLVFVGDGPLLEPLRELADSLGLRGVHVLPFQNQSMMPAIYSLGDLLVLPSQSETWGLVVNEAMNLDCPAIVSDHVGCSHDLVLPGETGWVFTTGDVQGLSRCLAEALAEPERLAAMGRQARRHVARFSYEGLTASLLQALGRLLPRRAPAA